MHPRTPLVLASESPRRRDILSRLEVGRFRVEAAGVDETPPPGLEPALVAKALARRKVDAISPRVERGVVIGADTIVVLDDAILGKPRDADAARAGLRALSGRTHEVITGLALHHRPSGRRRDVAVTTRVTLRELTDREIDDYIATGDPFDKAGGYGIQGAAKAFVTDVVGSYDNVVGFPSERFVELLAEIEAEVSRDGGEAS